ncbi:hypothetical protein LY76DRAFT_412220 [Colletotrichum caudatum]|nr:hypothetical protein LY76DRAFT_412220 [Colletotrichum caudatum]
MIHELNIASRWRQVPRERSIEHNVQATPVLQICSLEVICSPSLIASSCHLILKNSETADQSSKTASDGSKFQNGCVEAQGV